MKCSLELCVCLAAALCASAATAQDAVVESKAVSQTSSADSPVAYVYVSATPKNSSTSEVVAYTTNPDGNLTPIPGSPFRESLSFMAATGSYLFGVAGGAVQGENIDSFAIEHNGALRFSTETDLSKYDLGYDEAASAGLWLDHTGATLYNLQYLIDGSNSAYESFAIDKANGSLSMPGDLKKSISNTLSAAWPATSNSLSFTANNKFAYSAVCWSDKAWIIYGFERHSDGSLTELPINPAFPTGASDEGFCPAPFAAADKANHVAFVFDGEIDPPFGTPAGSPQLATYTVSADGNLTTTSTYKNMPFIATTDVADLQMSWSGKLLAVGGSGGLEVFHFNGADPITPYTGLLTKDSIDQLAWDASGNLFAISKASGKLFVFMTTSTSIKQAPGSPHSIPSPQALAVHSLTSASE
jgi:hypothetical protein